MWLLIECTFQNENIFLCIFARIYFTVFVQSYTPRTPQARTAIKFAGIEQPGEDTGYPVQNR